MSQSFTHSSVKSTPRKRRRGDDHAPTVVQESSKSEGAYASSGTVLGSVEISEVSEKGKYIKMRNMSPEVKTGIIFPPVGELYSLQHSFTRCGIAKCYNIYMICLGSIYGRMEDCTQSW